MKSFEEDKERFFSKIAKESPDECWIWQGGKDRNGFGKFWANDKTEVAHVVAWMIANNADYPEETIAHLCPHNSCCNPKHLVLNSDPKVLLYRFWDKVDKTPGFGPNFDCWKWKGFLNRDGYGAMRWHEGNEIGAHRISWEIHNGPILNKLHIRHSCHEPSCVNPAHLSLGTHQDNMNDRKNSGRNGRSPGEKNGKAVLKESQVIDIYKRVMKGENGTKIAAEYGISKVQVSYIKLGKSWGHVTKDIIL